MSRPGLFLNTSSDTTILRDILEAASEARFYRLAPKWSKTSPRYEMEPLFIPGCPTESSLGSDR